MLLENKVVVCISRAWYVIIIKSTMFQVKYFQLDKSADAELSPALMK